MKYIEEVNFLRMYEFYCRYKVNLKFVYQKADIVTRAAMDAMTAVPDKSEEALDIMLSPVHCIDIFMPSMAIEKLASTIFWFMHL